MWSLTSGLLLGCLLGHRREITDISVRVDDCYVASADMEGVITLVESIDLFLYLSLDTPQSDQYSGCGCGCWQRARIWRLSTIVATLSTPSTYAWGCVCSLYR